ncbi:hypothetical protein Acsp03_55950 [Actinomadura sp. NBRC 104412]|uniref:hypothetical protein n=1 Tax=Actinomadura sp. NBRC 104412 TaxID=3032203 RepID=UPI0024A35F12|nr:hypothetical protein [Actinomadura sp. NBRC 104412]GLZ08129.1 hypothetical protein Acsp03_55950 [Actinomadura sp. NBRC 104412]
MWWLIPVGFVAILLAYGVVVDVRARRRGRRIRIKGNTVPKEARQDVRAWLRGSFGHSGEGVSWMRSSRRRKGAP